MRAALQTIPNVLTIAGSDPSGGAGIQADLKTFAALGCFGMAAITALTAQNTQGVRAIHLPPPDFVAEQITTVFADIDVKAVKIGMLGSRDIVRAVSRSLAPHRAIPIVLDPVLVATSGALLADDDVVDAMRDELFPLVTMVTPNLIEAARLSGRDIPFNSNAAIEEAARSLRGSGPAAWLIKGGHRDAITSDDFLIAEDEARWFSSPRLDTRHTHGTGCTLSSAIAAHIARGASLREAVGAAKAYLDSALAGADRLRVGQGSGPLDHFVRWR